MDANELVRGYLVLGLRLGRLVSGFVDSFTGDPALSRSVDNEPRLAPKALAQHARQLQRELPGTDLADQRKQFLQAHLTALECTARKLAGERITFVDEVERYFQVRIRPGDEDSYALAHRKLAREMMDSAEENPVLGLRGIRLTLARPQVFRVQLRALLRAAPHGDLWIMAPLVSRVEEIRALRAALAETAAELDRAGVTHGTRYRLGIMVEVPAAALMADVKHFLERLANREHGYLHNCEDCSDCERKNADAHIRAIVLGHAVTLPIQGGNIPLGQWQSILFAELDGPRERSLTAQVIGV